MSGRPTIDSSLKYAIAVNIRNLREQRGLDHSALVEILRTNHNITITDHAVRSWEGSKAIPSLSTLIALSSVFGVTLDELVGVKTQLKNGSESLFEIIRPIRNQAEENIIRLVRKVTENYPQMPEGFDIDEQTRKRLFRDLLFLNLIKVNASNLHRHRNTGLEHELKMKKKLKDVQVFTLPGLDKHRGIKQFFFAAATADYLQKIVAQGALRIGLACGTTIASMVHLTERGHLQKVELFPILLQKGKAFSATMTSPAIVQETVFRNEDFGVQMPEEDIYEETFFERYLSTADALFFGLGNNTTSTFVKVLNYLGFDEMDELKKYFAGDLLFNLLTTDGKTVDELKNATSSDDLKKLVEKLSQELEKPEIVDSRVKLDLVSTHAQQRGLGTVAMAFGKEKAKITRAMFARKKPVCNVLITDVSLAEELVKEAEADE